MKFSSINTFISKLRIIGENLSALKIKGIRTYMTGQLVSLLGDWMQQTTQAWVVWELTHKAAAFNVTAEQAFIGELAGPGNIKRAIALNNSLNQLTRLAGPAIAGWLIASTNAAIAFWCGQCGYAWDYNRLSRRRLTCWDPCHLTLCSTNKTVVYSDWQV